MLHNINTNNIHSLITKEAIWIGETAVLHLPESGTIFIDKGNVSYQFALSIPIDCKLHIFTSSTEIFTYLSSNTQATVSLIDTETLSFSVSFIDIAAIDAWNGNEKIIKISHKCIGLCNSSTLTKFFNSPIIPVSSFNCIITDKNADTDIVMELAALGVEVVLAGPRDNCVHKS